MFGASNPRTSTQKAHHPPTHDFDYEMLRQGESWTEMARRMGTSRAALDRLLDPANESVTLQTLLRAAAALGMELEVGLRDAAQ